MGLVGGPEGMLADWPLVTEVTALARGRLCRGEERRRCRTESGDFADWACGECREFVRFEAISPWTWHLVFLYQLQEAGYPFRANELSVETWLLLGVVKRAFTAASGGHHGRKQFHEWRKR